MAARSSAARGAAAQSCRLLAREIGEAAAPVGAERQDGEGIRRLAPGRRQPRAGGIADDHARRGVAQEIVDLARRIGGVERQEDGAGAQRAEVEGEGLRRFLDLGGDAVARPHAARAERSGHRRGTGMQLGIGPGRGGLRQHQGDGARRGAAFQSGKEVVRHAGSDVDRGQT